MHTDCFIKIPLFIDLNLYKGASCSKMNVKYCSNYFLSSVSKDVCLNSRDRFSGDNCIENGYLSFLK